jgi:hypothetical protein
MHARGLLICHRVAACSTYLVFLYTLCDFERRERRKVFFRIRAPNLFDRLNGEERRRAEKSGEQRRTAERFYGVLIRFSALLRFSAGGKAL